MKQANSPDQPSLAVATTQPQAVAIAPPTSLDILEKAVRGGVTSENVAVVKEIIAMRREEVSAASKASFNRAFFDLRRELGGMDFYADKAAMNNGKVAYRYCSETELSAGLEPVLFRHGFAMMFGQRSEDGKIVAEVTLIHKDGHEEKREFAVRSGSTNAFKDATAADTGAATSAWRHLVIKMFGLKSRICESDDARNLGDLAKKITPAQAAELEHRLKMVNHNPAKILSYVGAATLAEIPALMFDVADRMLEAIENPRK
jgi:hypothetical protein